MPPAVRPIRELLQRYASAVDARDLAAVRSCFTEDAAYEGSLAGNEIEVALTDLATRWREYERTQHSLGCQIVDVAAGRNRAHAETYVTVLQERRREDRLECRRVVLCYRDDLVRRLDGWRIARRRVRSYFRLDWTPTPLDQSTF